MVPAQSLWVFTLFTLGTRWLSGQQARGLASLQGLHLVIFSCFSFLFLFQLSTPRVSHLSTLCSLGCPVYNMLSLKRLFVLRSIANSPPGSCGRDKGSKVSRRESMHTSPPEPKGCMDLMGWPWTVKVSQAPRMPGSPEERPGGSRGMGLHLSPGLHR